jgi:hypothetical protein
MRARAPESSNSRQASIAKSSECVTRNRYHRAFHGHVHVYNSISPKNIGFCVHQTKQKNDRIEDGVGVQETIYLLNFKIEM